VADVTITIEGLDELVRRLEGSPQTLGRYMRRAMDKSIKTIQRKAQAYPPAPPGSSYKRTGTLGRRWIGTATGVVGNIKGILANPTPYGPYVMSQDEQAEMHKGRWSTIEQIAEDSMPEMEGFFQQELDAAVQELAG
jgi:hypothetical protein